MSTRDLWMPLAIGLALLVPSYAVALTLGASERALVLVAITVMFTALGAYELAENGRLRR